ncbi:hypothetical protein HY622_01485, partial [Candidatus Uhrbacteria bacterium]|nr:hypothetical protein [Candidatus Uhrbacteria bacterium]
MVSQDLVIRDLFRVVNQAFNQGQAVKGNISPDSPDNQVNQAFNQGQAVKGNISPDSPDNQVNQAFNQG